MSDDASRWRALVDAEVERRGEAFWAAQRARILARLDEARGGGARVRRAARPRRRAAWARAAAAAVLAGLAAGLVLWIAPADDEALLLEVSRLAAGPPGPLAPLDAGLALGEPGAPLWNGGRGRVLPAGLDWLAPGGLVPAVPPGPADEWLGGDDEAG